MKRRVNLYVAELQPEICLVSPNLAMATWGAALLLIGVLALFGTQKQQALGERKAQLDFQLQSKRGMHKALEEAKLKRVPDPTLREALLEQQQVLASKQRIRNELKRREALKYQGFSNLMLDLAQQHDGNVWLTQISLDENKLRLQGHTLDSAAVPKWINSLSDTEFFAGREFAAARVFREAEDQPLAFVLDTEQQLVLGGETDE